MARTTKNRTVFSTACATAALALVGPFALVGAYAATVNVNAAHTVPVAQTTASVATPIQTRMIAATPTHVDNQVITVSDLMAAVPDPSQLGVASPDQSQSAQKTIVAQLDAFRSGDFEQADTYQSSSLRASFPSTQQFRIAMSQVYPEFTAYKSVQFGMTRADKTGRFIFVPTTLTGQDGVTVQALYVMVSQQPTAAQTELSATTSAATPTSGYQVLTVLGGMNPHPILNQGTDYQMT